ncbi:hypothetical protein MPG02_00360 [Helicobacter pylori]|nr:hypothetical protein [Helicobacter pylori]UOS32852.1 hypothetical protein MPG02_00360 [Helicobacter pylori]
MGVLGVKYSLTLALKTLFLGSLVSGFSSVLCVSVMDRCFYSRIACVIGSFIIGYIAYYSFRIQTPLFRRLFGLKLR